MFLVSREYTVWHNWFSRHCAFQFFSSDINFGCYLGTYEDINMIHLNLSGEIGENLRGYFMMFRVLLRSNIPLADARFMLELRRNIFFAYKIFLRSSNTQRTIVSGVFERRRMEVPGHEPVCFQTVWTISSSLTSNVKEPGVL